MEREDEDLELGDVLEEEAPPAPEPEVADPPEGGAPPDPRLATMEAQITALMSRPNGNEELVALGKQFLERQNQPAPVDPAAGQADLAAFGKQLQESAILGKPEEFAALFMQAVNAVSERNVNAALQKHGTPLAEKAGDYAVATYMSARRDDAGPNGEKLHKAVQKAIVLAPNEKQWIASAPTQQAKAFLDAKYEQAAGRVLLASSSRARPQNIGGGGAGGSGAGSVTALPGLDARAQRNAEKLAEMYWPDPKVRAEKLKAAKAAMEAV
jgi:hypothetical protein